MGLGCVTLAAPRSTNQPFQTFTRLIANLPLQIGNISSTSRQLSALQSLNERRNVKAEMENNNKGKSATINTSSLSIHFYDICASNRDKRNNSTQWQDFYKFAL